MFRRVGSTLLVLALLLVVHPVWAQLGRSQLISQMQAQRFGLKRSWHAQVRLDRGRGRITYVVQSISPTRTETIYQVVSERDTVDFSERSLGRFGDQLGPLGAIELAASRIIAQINDIKAQNPDAVNEELTATEQAAQQVLVNVTAARQQPEETEEGPAPVVNIDDVVSPLLRRGVAMPEVLPKLVRVVVPDIMLHVATNQGVVHAIDGHTGRTRWTTPVGRPNLITSAPAANDDYVAIVNGSTLTLMESQTGTLLFKRRLNGVPGGPPAMNRRLVSVPLVNGKLETYDFEVITQRFQIPHLLVSSGRSMVRPAMTSSSLGWSTDRGIFVVADAVDFSRRYRLEAGATIVSPATFVTNHAPANGDLPWSAFLVGSVDGYAYCIHEFRGDLIWRFSAGEPISHSPIPIGQHVYVISDNGGMYQISLDTGQEIWWTANVKRFVGASENRIYCTNDVGQLVILDRATGGRIAVMPTLGLDLEFTNWQTDRLFVGTKSGLLMCLHETQLDRPLFHMGVEVDSAVEDEDDQGEEGEEAAEDAPADTDDPFGGGGSNPFGGGGESSNPFGGGDSNPFGGGTSDSPADSGSDSPNPFGGDASNPFG